MANTPYKPNPRRSNLENYGKRQINSGLAMSKTTYKTNVFTSPFHAIKQAAKVSTGAIILATGRVGRRVGLLSRSEKNARISTGLKKSNKVKNRRRR